MKSRLILPVIAVVLLSTALGPIASTQAADAPSNGAPYAIPFRPLNPAGYAQAKALANAQAGLMPVPAPLVGPLVPGTFVSWQGINNTTLTPSDSTGAIGTTEYIEFINTNIAVYGRNGSLLSQNTMTGFSGRPSSDFVSDPQMIYDPNQGRFFYAFLDANSLATNWRLAFGFSKGSAPTTNSSDWCSYASTFGRTYGSNGLPDYPKLGDTADFILIGVNRFNAAGTLYLGSDVAWVAKPAPGIITTCPSLSTLKMGVAKALRNADGTLLSTPVPAHEIDSSHTGWVVGQQDLSTVPSSNYITVYQVTKSSSGTAVITLAATIPVASFSMPPSAPQSGTSDTLDTLDGRFEQGMAAVDPTLGQMAIWAIHTVAGGAGSKATWYEINTSPLSLAQTGDVSDPSLYVFNASISSDRVVNGSATAFGSNMVVNFNTSSASTFSAIQVVSKIGSNPQSGFVLVKQSPGKNVDFSCTPVCRWGDYSGASPDPAAATNGNAGQVWITNMWNVASTNNSNVDWRTWNAGITP